MERAVVAISLMATGSVAAQTAFTPTQCSRDSQGNQVCDWHAAGQQRLRDLRIFRLADSDTLRRCHRPENQAGRPTVYPRVLGGESDEVPSQLLFDPQDNVVIFGTTYSKQFPTTPDGGRRIYAGPQAP